MLTLFALMSGKDAFFAASYPFDGPYILFKDVRLG
jgi:hypothetical protein